MLKFTNAQIKHKIRNCPILTKNFYDYFPQISCDTEAKSSRLLHYPPNNELLAKHT